MLDADLARLYGVSTRRLNEQIRRNRDRFPEDFTFVLTPEEFSDLKSHFATSSSRWGGRRKVPYAFTEHGAIMAANVLSSPTAVCASIQVVRAFVRLREFMIINKDLARKLEDLERKYAAHDVRIQQIFSCIKKLMSSPAPRRRPIGFILSEERE